MKNEQKWYKTKVGIIASLIIFFPAGLFLMWKYTEWNKYIKWGITGFFILILIAGASGDAENTQSTTSTTTVSAVDNKPSSTSKPTEILSYDLNAEVRYSEDAFMITNIDEKGWTGCKLELNSGIISGGYNYRETLILPNEPLIIPFREFTKGDGTRFDPYETKAQKLVISCDEYGETGKRGFGYFTINQ